MDAFLQIAGLLVLFLFCVAALASLVVGLPGTFLIVLGAAIYAWATGFETVRWATLGWLLLLALIGEGVELVAAGAGAAGERPSRRVSIAALAGAFVGGLAGTPFLFGVGSLIGALLGAFAGAAIAVTSQGGSFASAFRTGYGALRGRFLGFLVKAAIAMGMIVLLFVAAL